MDGAVFEILYGIGRFFLHPFTYVFLLVILWFGMQRAKRERKDFHTRVQDVVQDLLSPLGAALVTAAAVSVLALLGGIEMNAGMLALWALIWVLLLPLRNARWLSMTTAGAIAIAAAPFIPDGGTGVALLNSWMADINAMDLRHAAWLLALLFAAEALLVTFNGWKQPSPAVVKSRRGKLVGAHYLSKLWYMPLFLIFPAGNIEGAGWWPVLEISGEGSFGLALFPFLLGMQTIVQSEMPAAAVKKTGKRLILLSAAVLACAAAAFWYPVMLFAVPLLVFTGKELIFAWHRSADKSRISLFTRRETGMKILGVLPGSTANRMGLETGEIIMKTNGREVYSQRSFYDALQQNPAYCKLEVVDLNGEPRLTQSTVYEGDHYQIGCLFVPDDEFGNLTHRGLRSSVVIQQDRTESGHRSGTGVYEPDDEQPDGEGLEETAAASDKTEEAEQAISEEAEVSGKKTDATDSGTVEELPVKPAAEAVDKSGIFAADRDTLPGDSDLPDKDIEKKEAFFASSKEAHKSGAPYGQASGLSAFYDEFRDTKTERNKWRPKTEEGDSNKSDKD